MLTCEQSYGRFGPIDHPADAWPPRDERSRAEVRQTSEPSFHRRLTGPARGGAIESRHRSDGRDGFEPARTPVDVDDVLRRLARHRIGHDEIDVAFRPDELRRIRRFLVFVGETRGRLVRPRRDRRALTMAARRWTDPAEDIT